MNKERAEEILTFWFSDEVEAAWFKRNEAVDREIEEHFAQAYESARLGEMNHWRNTTKEALALTIVLDQFPRNLFRGSPRSFESDHLALANAKYALEQGYEKQLSKKERPFFYLPFMHSEDVKDQRRCITLYEELGNDLALDFAKQHADIINRFGRFPHRNAVLGRETTTEEAEFLTEHPGF